jgi:hypothetical protein
MVMRRVHKRRNASVSAPELKALDTAVVAAVDTTGAIQLLNGIEPGTALNQRVGRQITMVKLQYHLQSIVTAATGIDQFHRLLVVLDKQPNGVALAINSVLDGGSTSQYNLSNQHRFVILYDKRFYLNASGEAGSGIVLDGTIGLSAVVQYNSGIAGTVADIATNSLYLIALGNVVAGATAGSLAGSVRLRYYDE